MARVLVVEDDAVLAGMIEMLLESDHHEVLLAGDGDAAVACAEAQRPDVIFMDIMLPRRSGLDAAQQIATSSNAEVASIPMIAMSAGTNLVVVSGSGYFAGVLPKPFDIDTAIALVHMHARKTAS